MSRNGFPRNVEKYIPTFFALLPFNPRIFIECMTFSTAWRSFADLQREKSSTALNTVV